MLHNGNNYEYALPFHLEHTRVVALIHTSIIPPPDYGAPIDAKAQGRSVPIFGRRDTNALLT